MTKTEILNYIIQNGLEQQFINRLLELQLVQDYHIWNCSKAIEGTWEIVTDLFCLIS